jgi:preprotein translocase subunit SecG
MPEDMDAALRQAQQRIRIVLAVIFIVTTLAYRKWIRHAIAA